MKPLPRLSLAARLGSVAVLLSIAAQAAGAAEPSPRKPSAKRPTTHAKTAAAHRKPAQHKVAKPPAQRPAVGPYAEREDVREFVRMMSERHGFDASALGATFARVQRIPDVLKLISPPAPTFKRSWEAYRARFLDPLRIREGLRFWRDHEAALQRAQETWRVPPEIVVAIIGVETIYGRMTGDFRIIEALSTLAFDYPRRAAFFREELEQYLLYARAEGIDAFDVRGSFAGAIGLPQFMPGSIRRYAIDFDGDGRIDLRASPVDAVGSVARFLAEHGWVGGEPTHFGVSIGDPARLPALIEAGIEPRFTAGELADLAVTSPDPIRPGTLLALVDLPNADKPPTYLLGARNFYVITRYNRSSFYAMAVIELAQVLANAR